MHFRHPCAPRDSVLDNSTHAELWRRLAPQEPDTAFARGPITGRTPMHRLLLAALAAVFVFASAHVAAQSNAKAPQFAVDPFWPKPLPDKWILGQVAGIAVDGKDNVWIIHRPSTLVDDEKGAQKSPPETRCCIAPPPVLQFSPDGRLLRSWGGPGTGYDWPKTEH